MKDIGEGPWSVGVIVPAQNEELTIVRCIDSIRLAVERAGVGHFWIVVVADTCTDRTAELARRTLGTAGEVLEVQVSSAGAARRAGAAAVLRHFPALDPATLWLANTDADTRVPPDWITVQLEHATDGITGVAGIVLLDSTGSAAAHDIYRRTYLTTAEGTHSHVHGANLSLRADAYLDVGGWSERPLAEDHCLWGRLRHRGWRVSSPVASVVTTSARLEGRARGGFADTLRAAIDALPASA